MVETVGSEYFTNNVRENVDRAKAGNEVIITRWGEPQAVLVPFDAWTEWRDVREEQRKQVLQQN